jgi:hypothetical protein
MKNDGRIKELCWEQNEIPAIYTPVNSLDLLKDKRLIMLVWYIDETMVNQYVVGHVNVPLMNFYKIHKDDGNS